MSLRPGEQFKRLHGNQPGEKLSASEYNRLVALIENMAASLMADGIMDSTGFHTRSKPVPASGPNIRWARTREAAGEGTTIQCNLLDSNGDEIDEAVTVYCNVTDDTTDLQDCSPRLLDDTYLLVIDRGDGDWWAFGNFEPTGRKVFEVQSAAAGDGVYNCYEQTLDATEWTDTAGDDKFDDKDATSVEVLNLLENDPEATYKECLAIGDRIKAWKWTDDEGNSRWVGIPIAGGFSRRAKTTQPAPADTKITANLIGNDGNEITTGLGSGIDVYCDIAGGGNLNAAVPRLTDNFEFSVYNLQGKWYCTTAFQATEDCDCYSAP